MTEVEHASEVLLTKDTPYLALAGELRAVFCEDLGETRLRYNGNTLHLFNATLISSRMRSINSLFPVCPLRKRSLCIIRWIIHHAVFPGGLVTFFNGNTPAVLYNSHQDWRPHFYRFYEWHVIHTMETFSAFALLGLYWGNWLVTG